MPIWLAVPVSILGVMFFTGHVLWVRYALRCALTPEQRREFFGKVIPGLAGLLVAAAPWVSFKPFAAALCLAGMIIIILGRGVYEMFVFRNRG